MGQDYRTHQTYGNAFVTSSSGSFIPAVVLDPPLRASFNSTPVRDLGSSRPDIPDISVLFRHFDDYSSSPSTLGELSNLQ